MARANPVSYSVDEVRVAATGTSFSEIDHNEDSRVLSFGNQSGTRINVYYTTGTVGTCLNHPTKGKTQLFRRGVSLNLLARIFKDPRIHTGTGYYRKNNRQSWKTIRKDGSQAFEVDSARRWRYVASVTGLSTCEKELDKIAKFCHLYDSMSWDRGAEPKLSTRRNRCGNSKAFIEMLFDVMHDLLGYPVQATYTGRDDQESNPYRVITPGKLPFCQPSLVAFLKEHEANLRKLKRQLQSFREDIQIELAQWFLGRDKCGYSLTTSDELVISTDFTLDIYDAHFAYAEFSYTKKSIAKMCRYHGLLWGDADCSS